MTEFRVPVKVGYVHVQSTMADMLLLSAAPQA
jgi:hypothetical protein